MAQTSAMAADFDWQKHKGKKLKLLLNKHPYVDAMVANLNAFKTLTGMDVTYDVFPEDVYFDKVTARFRPVRSTNLLTGPTLLDLFRQLDLGPTSTSRIRRKARNIPVTTSPACSRRGVERVPGANRHRHSSMGALVRANTFPTTRYVKTAASRPRRNGEDGCDGRKPLRISAALRLRCGGSRSLQHHQASFWHSPAASVLTSPAASSSRR